jgi:cobalt-zinc-cadmium efflux system protein
MGHSHSHHGHNHHHPINYGRAFAIGIFLNISFIVVEVIFGLMANSLALLADAGHNFSDVIGLVVAWGASWLSQWHPTDKYTYGFRRSSILAALINALLLLVAIGGIVWEAIGRLMHPVVAHAPTIIGVAAVGVAINTATALLFVAGRKSDLNTSGAYLHMAADAAISAGVVVAGVLIALTGIQLIDPVISIAVAAIIFAGTWGLLRQSVNLAIDAVPEQIDADKVALFLSGLPTVQNVHHLHIWGLSTTDVALTAHMVLSRPDNNDALLAQIREELHHRFDINHATIQFESTESGICLTRRCTLHSCRGGKNEDER